MKFKIAAALVILLVSLGCVGFSILFFSAEYEPVNLFSEYRTFLPESLATFSEFSCKRAVVGNHDSRYACTRRFYEGPIRLLTFTAEGELILELEIIAHDIQLIDLINQLDQRPTIVIKEGLYQAIWRGERYEVVAKGQNSGWFITLRKATIIVIRPIGTIS